MNTAYVIRMRTKSGRTWSYRKMVGRKPHQPGSSASAAATNCYRISCRRSQATSPASASGWNASGRRRKRRTVRAALAINFENPIWNNALDWRDDLRVVQQRRIMGRDGAHPSTEQHPFSSARSAVTARKLMVESHMLKEKQIRFHPRNPRLEI